MYQQLAGNGVIVFSDPAGAKACLALVAILKKKYPSASFRIFSNKQYDFYKDWPVQVEIRSDVHEELLSDINPAWIFAGTSHPDSSNRFELGWIRVARKLAIPTWSFIDHWTCMSLRFEDGGIYTYPDHIVVVDELAKTLAVNDNVPENLLAVCKNPYIEYICDYWIPRQDVAMVRKTLGIGPERMLLYAPDPFSLRNEDGYWEFDELTALKDLLAVCSAFSDVKVVIKKHPLQPQGSLEAVAADFDNNQYIFAPDLDNLDIMNAADLIVGFHSNFLIEANALQKDIIRYFPKSQDKDELHHLSIGQKVTNKISLQNSIKTILC